MISRVRLMLLMAAMAVLALLVVGCGGGDGGSSGTTLLQGNPAHRAAILAGYQSFAAGVAFPFTALKIIAPAGSAVANGGNPMTGASVKKKHIASAPVFVPALNLYVTGPNGTSNVITLNYFTDAAGTQPAGSVTMTLPVASTDGSTNYLSYPVVVPIVVNLTAGNIPCSGTVTVNFTGSSGVNTMTGTLSLPSHKINYTINLTLSDTLQVAGTITGHENGATINLTNCRGDLFGTLNCDLAISPYGWTGTATGSLVTGVFSTQINTTSGSATSSVDASTGNLNITYPDGTKESVSQPLTAALIAGSGTGTGGTGTGGTSGGLSIGSGTILSGAAFLPPVTINNAGQILTTAFDPAAGQFYASATSAPKQIPSYSGSSEESVVSAMNAHGQIVGGLSPDKLDITIDVPLYWSSATAQPVLLPLGTFTKLRPIAITDTGVIVGTLPDRAGLVYWPTPTTAPKAVTMPTTGVVAVVAGVSSDGQIAGEVGNQNGNPIYAYWSSPAATPTKMASVIGNSALRFSINTHSQIVYADQNTNSYYWSSPSATPIQLPAIATGFTNTAQATGSNAAGIIVGNSFASATGGDSHAVFWSAPNQAPVDINTLLPAGSTVVLDGVVAINDQGQALCTRFGNPTDNFSSTVVIPIK